VQRVLTTKTNTKTKRHAFEFRRLLTCGACNKKLIGERQKGHVYYRCHTQACQTKTIREEEVRQAMRRYLERLVCLDDEKKYFRAKLFALRESWTRDRDTDLRSVRLQLEQVGDRLNRLTDAYLDQALDKEMFEQRKKSLLMERLGLEDNVKRLEANVALRHERVSEFLELVSNASLSHPLALPEERREMVTIATSNRFVNGKNVVIEPSIPFREIANRFEMTYCDPHRGIPRTWDVIIDQLITLNTRGQLPDLSLLHGCTAEDITGEISFQG
jgi:site-specific DNA recombinase